jgi:two-component system, cell cycle sensor histidine kinase and response regulator CckA
MATTSYTSRPVIVVADDEPFVLNIVSCILRNAGFEVFPAASPREALEIARTYAAPIRLLLSDVIMPELSGPMLADEFTAIHPETECMFMAGLPDTPEVCERIIRRGRAFLPKPFVPSTLISKVQEVLANSPAAGGSLVLA